MSDGKIVIKFVLIAKMPTGKIVIKFVLFAKMPAGKIERFMKLDLVSKLLVRIIVKF